MELPVYRVDTLLWLVNFFGLIAFAFSGAIAAFKRKTDILGMVILSLVASVCGGIIRDILIGDLPPEIMRSYLPLVIAISTGAITFFFSKHIPKLSHPIDLFDAIGIGMYTVLGADKALAYGIDPVWSIGLGVITAVGGGITRDVLLARVPTILRSEIYVTPALLGAAVMVVGRTLTPIDSRYFMVLGAVLCTGLRLLALHYKWNMHRN